MGVNWVLMLVKAAEDTQAAWTLCVEDTSFSSGRRMLLIGNIWSSLSLNSLL